MESALTKGSVLTGNKACACCQYESWKMSLFQTLKSIVVCQQNIQCSCGHQYGQHKYFKVFHENRPAYFLGGSERFQTGIDEICHCTWLDIPNMRLDKTDMYAGLAWDPLEKKGENTKEKDKIGVDLDLCLILKSQKKREYFSPKKPTENEWVQFSVDSKSGLQNGDDEKMCIHLQEVTKDETLYLLCKKYQRIPVKAVMTVGGQKIPFFARKFHRYTIVGKLVSCGSKWAYIDLQIPCTKKTYLDLCVDQDFLGESIKNDAFGTVQTYVDAAFLEYDKDKSFSFSKKEASKFIIESFAPAFLAPFYGKQNVKVDEKNLEKVFNMIDADGSGEISKEELLNFLFVALDL